MRSPVQENGTRTEQSTTWTDPKTALEVRVDVTTFRGFPAVEWVLHFTNNGSADTPILENILPLDAKLGSPSGDSDPVLHYAKGALCCIDDYAPLTEHLVGDKHFICSRVAGDRRANSCRSSIWTWPATEL